MMEENKAMHSDGCTCDSGKMMHFKHKHYMLKFVVGMILLFMAFWIGVQMGEIKGALGMTPQYRSMMYQRGGMMQTTTGLPVQYQNGMQY
jgi:hypothetical protein